MPVDFTIVVRKPMDRGKPFVDVTVKINEGEAKEVDYACNVLNAVLSIFDVTETVLSPVEPPR